jgi:chaperonin GroEL (HSP60 family)
MKQKYLIINDKENKQFKIQEFAELNKETLSLLCEEAYDYKTIKSAVSTGKDALISALRTNNLYPPVIYAEKIAAAVIQLYKSKDKESLELFFDDINLLDKKRQSSEITQDFEGDAADRDEMLEDDFDDNYPEKSGIEKLDSSLKVEDDDYVDTNDDGYN